MDEISTNPLLRAIPSIDKILIHGDLDPLRARYAEDLVRRMVRAAVDELREEIRSGRVDEEECGVEAVIARAVKIADSRLGRRLRILINATGVIVHTNLGRSPLSERVVERIGEVARTYSNLEYDLDKGNRGERNAHLRHLLREITGAESALAVNNNAAAVLLALGTLAQGREVVVSRGELIEIGGSFRIPDVMARSGAFLKEVGTTNRTHLSDYSEAINQNTALILKVHTSNYRIVGFTSEVELTELVRLGREKQIPTMMDLGSGCLIDLAAYGLPDEMTVQESIATGVDIVSFSGDKLLGGPQAGILAGRADLIERMRSNPLARALRMDKMTLAGLEATLEEYTRPRGSLEGIPTLAMITRPAEEIKREAETLATAILEQITDLVDVTIEAGIGRVGGGALPLGDLPGVRVAIRPKRTTAARLEQALRGGDPPMIAMVKDDALLIDPRTLLGGQASLIPDLIAAALKRDKELR